MDPEGRAPGIDGVTAQEYAEHLEANLANLHERLRSGRYRAPPVRRTHLDKEDGSQRPIGIPAFEDKIVQRAVVMRLGAFDEQDFLDCSHGFREGHSPHQALHELREQCMELDIGWVVDADVSACFLIRFADDCVPRRRGKEEVDLEASCCTGDGGRPSGVGLQDQAPNHLKL